MDETDELFALKHERNRLSAVLTGIAKTTWSAGGVIGAAYGMIARAINALSNDNKADATLYRMGMEAILWAGQEENALGSDVDDMNWWCLFCTKGQSWNNREDVVHASDCLHIRCKEITHD